MSGGSSTSSNPFIKEPNIARPKFAPHLVTGFVPVDTKFQQTKEEFSKLNLSQYAGGLPYRGIYTRRNNPDALNILRHGGNINVSSPQSFQTRFNVAHPKFPLLDYTSAALNLTTT